MRCPIYTSDSDDSEAEYPFEENPPAPGIVRINPTEVDEPRGESWSMRPVPIIVSLSVFYFLIVPPFMHSQILERRVTAFREQISDMEDCIRDLREVHGAAIESGHYDEAERALRDICRFEALIVVIGECLEEAEQELRDRRVGGHGEGNSAGRGGSTQ